MPMNVLQRCGARGLAGIGFVLLLAAVVPRSALAQPAAIDPQAQQLLKASTTYLGALGQFSADTRSTTEVVLPSGQKLQFDNTVTMAVQRPNKLYAKRLGDRVDQVFYYDGMSLTLHNPAQNNYAAMPAPATLEEALDMAREKLDIVAPAGDLIYSNAFDILMQDVTEGIVIGKAVIEGVRCDHLAFRAPHVDWQIWIQEGRQPLPRKFVITSRDMLNSPQFSVVITRWNVAPKHDAGLFSFKPPKDARKVDFLPR